VPSPLVSVGTVKWTDSDTFLVMPCMLYMCFAQLSGYFDETTLLYRVRVSWPCFVGVFRGGNLSFAVTLANIAFDLVVFFNPLGWCYSTCDYRQGWRRAEVYCRQGVTDGLDGLKLVFVFPYHSSSPPSVDLRARIFD
jgi:hypothetical protein